MRNILAPAAVVLLGACTVGPNFTAPAAPPPQAGYASDGGGRATLGEGPDLAWWKAFGSPELDALVNRAIANNHSLAASKATLERARERINAVRGRTLPQVDANARAEYQQLNLAAFGFDAFASNNGQIPPKGEYDGPLFSLSHAWPATVTPPPTPAPWQQAIGNGPVTVKNAYAYVQALKAYVAPDMRRMLEDPAHWDAAASGWYNEPWLGGIRESIHGTYVGSDYFPASLFAKSGLKAFSSPTAACGGQT